MFDGNHIEQIFNSAYTIAAQIIVIILIVIMYLERCRSGDNHIIVRIDFAVWFLEK